MAKQRYITMDGASFGLAYILSFDTQKEFVETHKDEFFRHHKDMKIRKKQLAIVFKLAKKLNDDNLRHD